MERIIIQNKRDIAEAIRDIRHDLSAIRACEFDLRPVTKYSALKGISFDIKQEARLKEIGAFRQCPDWDYGYFRSNENNAKVNNALTAADKLLSEILSYINDCYIRPKVLRFTEMELSRFEVIDGGGSNS